MVIEKKGTVFVRYLVLSFLALLFLIPFYIVLRNAGATDRIIIARKWVFWPWPMHFAENFRDMMANSELPIGVGLMNSLVTSVGQTFLHILFSAMTGYALARIPYKHAPIVFTFVLGTMMVPIQVTFVPTYIVIYKLKLVNTLAGIILPAVFNTFSAFMYRQFFLDFPFEIEEAGKLEGLNHLGLWWNLVMPNAVGVTISLTIINFFRGWNNFLWPLIVGQDASKWTIQVVLAQYITTQRITMTHVFLGSIIASGPIIALFFIMQKFIIRGTAMSGVKG